MDVHPFRELLRVVLRNGKRVAVLLLGLALVAGGLLMLVLPGPGLLVVVAGLAVLATEFAWAEHLLDRAKERAGRAKDKAGGLLRRGRRSP